jgi:predicted ester cyclase
VTKLNLDELLIDGDRAAAFNRLAAVQSGTGRTITYQRAEFFQFRDNKIRIYHAVLDSFDMAEQMLGHAINTSLTNAPSAFAANGDRIAL